MEFTPKQSKIDNIFQSELFYMIPKYQRKYVWKESKIKELWDDIKFSIKEAGKINYFLGCFIFQSDDTANCKIVIDGQQRLTSILILNSIICKHFIMFNDEFNIKETTKYCVLGDKKAKIDRARITNEELPLLTYIVDYCLTNNKYETLEDYLKAINYKSLESDKQLIFCYKYFLNSIEEDLKSIKSENRKIKYLENLRDSLLKVSVIEIAVEDSQSASLVFETINARGQELETHELIKNYLYMYEKAVRGVKVAPKKWEQILANVDSAKNSSITKFIAQYSTCIFGKTHKRDIFSVFKNNTPREKVNDRIENLLKFSNIYNNIVNCNSSKYGNKINYLLQCYKDMKISIIRPLLMSLLCAFDEGKITETKLIKYLTLLKNFLSIFVCVLEKKTNEIEDKIYEYAYSLTASFSDEKIQELFMFFKSKVTTIDEQSFIDAFSSLAFSKYPEKYNNVKMNKQKCQYILREFELYLQKNDDNTISSFSIEHVKDDCLGGSACFIGNLIPLPKSKNNNLSGKTILQKKTIYQKSCYLSSQKIAENSNIDSWDDHAILNRTKHMAKEFYNNVWKV